MADLDVKKVAEALGITEQQLEILVSIYRVESSGRRTSPKEIRADYLRAYGRGIQSPNYFMHTKKLQQVGFVKRTGAGVYGIDFPAIKKALEKKREDKVKELSEMDGLAEETSEYFRRFAYAPSKPVVEYLSNESMFASIAKTIKSANKIYVSANFPTIAYTYPVASGIGRGEFVKALWDRCFTKDKLQVFYLTTLDIDFLFNHSFSVYGDPEKAYHECKVILDQLENQVNTYENLGIRYINDLHGTDVLIPEKNGTEEMYLFTRDEHKNIQGGIHIQSVETASAAKFSFLRDFEYAQEIRGDKGKKTMQGIRKQLEEKYGKIKKIT
jgi:hypothetical protein